MEKRRCVWSRCNNVAEWVVGWNYRNYVCSECMSLHRILSENSTARRI